MKRIALALLLISCATTTSQKPEEPTPRDVTAAQRINAALSKIPACEEGADTQRLELGGACTLKLCAAVVKDGVASPAPACCNACSVAPQLVADDGTKTPVDLAKVKSLLDLGDSSYDCELKVWRDALEGTRFSLGETACIARAKDVTATKTVKAALAGLPKCKAGADVGRLVIKTTMCTRMFCNRACCNQCGWEAKFEGMSADAQPVDAARVKELLHLGESSLDCEVKAWAAALESESVSLDAKCVVR